MKIRAKKIKHKNVEDGYYRMVRLWTVEVLPFLFFYTFYVYNKSKLLTK